MKILIDDTTDAETTDPFDVHYDDVITLVSDGITGVEEIALQIAYTDTDFTAVYDFYNEVPVTLKATKNVIPISVPGTYKLVKPETAAAVTVSLYRSRKER